MRWRSDELRGHKKPIVVSVGDGEYYHVGVVDRIYGVNRSRDGEYQDFIVGGIKFVSRGDVLGFEEGDEVGVWFKLEGRVYKGRYLVNLIYTKFDFV